MMRNCYKFIGIFILWGFVMPAWAAALTETIQQIKNSVVAVGTFQADRVPQSHFLGTGFAVGNGQIIATNAHVVSSALDAVHFETFAVFLREQNNIKRFNVELMALDPVHDLALLKLTQGRLPPLTLSQKPVQEGQTIAFTGFPIGMVLGLYPVTHRGIISAITPVAIPTFNAKQLNAKIIRALKDPFTVYQLDATAYPGNSGSPVFDTDTGEVLGLINKVFVKETKESVLSNPSGITYAIPADYLKTLMEQKN